MAGDKRLIDEYEVMQSVKIDGMEIIMAEKPDTEKPYMMWRRSLSESFGAEKHLLPVFGSDYLKVLREFIRCQSTHADNLDLDRVYRGSPHTDAALTAEDCVEGGMNGDLRGKAVAVKSGVLSPEYRACSHQLMLATGGFGCSPGARGRAVLGVNIYSGGQERWERSDILGVVNENTLPTWAHEKLAALRKSAVKETVPADPMNKDRFWQIIDDTREKAGAWQDMYEPLLESLSQLEAPDIIHWQQIFYEYQELSYKEKLWAAAAVMHGGCSDDGFDYFRGWLTAQGKEVFMNALADPDSLAGAKAVQDFGRETLASIYTPMNGYYNAARFESMLSVAVVAYENKTGGDLYNVVDKYPLSGQEKAAIAGEITYAEDIGVKWGGLDTPWLETDAVLKKWLPNLHGTFNEAPVRQKSKEKESVLGKIRESGKQQKPRKPKRNNHDKGGPEL